MFDNLNKPLLSLSTFESRDGSNEGWRHGPVNDAFKPCPSAPVPYLEMGCKLGFSLLSFWDYSGT